MPNRYYFVFGVLVLITLCGRTSAYRSSDSAAAAVLATELRGDTLVEDSTSISDMSFVPTTKQLNLIIEQSSNAEDERHQLLQLDNEHRKCGPLLSKLSNLPMQIGLCPVSLSPDDTVLAKLGRNVNVEKVELSPAFAVINDVSMPLGSTSSGPNGILRQCEEEPFGSPAAPRVNLFYQSKSATCEMLDSYITQRDAHVNAIFDLFVTKLQQHNQGGKYEWQLRADKTTPVLPEEFRGMYSATVDMFSQIQQKVQAGEGSLGDYGIGIVSFCQTWLRFHEGSSDSLSPQPEFSVMSPHFQTRFYINSVSALKAAFPDLDLQPYRTLVSRFTGLMEEAKYGGASGKAFINLDDMFSEACSP